MKQKLFIFKGGFRMFFLEVLLCIFVLGSIVFIKCIKELVVGVDKTAKGIIGKVKEKYFTKTDLQK